jgi:hypothetical protein
MEKTSPLKRSDDGFAKLKLDQLGLKTMIVC